MNKSDSLKERSYYLSYDLSIPYEIKINGVQIAKNVRRGNMLDFQYLNPFILSSGTQVITFTATTLEPNQKYESINIKNIKLEIYVSKNAEDGPFELLKAFHLKPISKPVNQLQNSWSFEANVPYKITGWNNSKNLLKMDRGDLLNKINAFYKSISTLINNGDYKTYNKRFDEADKELKKCFYLTKTEYDQLVQKERINKIIKSKGHIKPIENFQMKFYANGKLVTLEKANGDSPLYAEAEDTVERFGFYLHIPRGSDRLKIIR